MHNAVIVGAVRTAVGRKNGKLAGVRPDDLLADTLKALVGRVKIDPSEVEDVVMGCAMQQGATGGNIARKALLRAGLPVSVAGTTIDRQCASGLQAIALAARSVIFDGVEVAIGGGGESISLVQNNQFNSFHAVDPELLADVDRVLGRERSTRAEAGIRRDRRRRARVPPVPARRHRASRRRCRHRASGRRRGRRARRGGRAQRRWGGRRLRGRARPSLPPYGGDGGAPMLRRRRARDDGYFRAIQYDSGVV